MSLHWRVFDDTVALNKYAAAFIEAQAAKALAIRGRFRVALAGGRTPGATYTLLRAAETNWARWEIYFSDERCVGADDPERNSRIARDCLLNHVPVGHLFDIPVEQGVMQAAINYGALVASRTPFDLVILGLGEDGHTASLFPGQKLDPAAWTVVVRDAPKPPSLRVSLGLRALRATSKLLVLASGANKQKAVRAWRGGASLPISAVTVGQTGLVLLDRVAGANAV
jgi:6-phosphogluconolactonase